MSKAMSKARVQKPKTIKTEDPDQHGQEVRRLLALLTLTIGCSGASGGGYEASLLCAIGDSKTASTPFVGFQPYTDHIPGTVNLGESGSRSQDWVPGAALFEGTKGCDEVVIWLGHNDWRPQPYDAQPSGRPDLTLDNIRQIAAQFDRAIVIWPRTRDGIGGLAGLWMARIRGQFHEICGGEYLCLDVEVPSEGYAVDGTHINRLGAELVGNAVAGALEEKKGGGDG